MRILFAFALGIFFSVQSASAASTFNCPQAIQLTIEIGQITLTDSDDSDFASLSGERFDGVYELESTLDSCVYIGKNSGNADPTQTKRYAQISENTRGGLTLDFEGYTVDSKVFGVSAKLKESNYQGDYKGTVSERSGVRRKLGNATVMIRSAD